MTGAFISPKNVVMANRLPNGLSHQAKQLTIIVNRIDSPQKRDDSRIVGVAVGLDQSRTRSMEDHRMIHFDLSVVFL